MGSKDDFIYKIGLIASEADKKSYRYLELENGLRVLLIHETEDSTNRTNDICSESESGDEGNNSGGDDECSGSEAEQSEDGDAKQRSSAVKLSAAALCIGTGSTCDEPELLGLAHYLEHMVFMGSEKYPSENDFDSFISERGGSTNAWTDMEQTLFHFDVQQESFSETVDKFAHFFVEPLLLEDSLEREVEAVNSEFEMSCTSVGSQIEFFCSCLMDEQHPLSGFKWGNRESLWTRPRAAGVKVRERLQQFRQKHYSAPNMTLVLQSRLELDELEAMARKSFSSVPNNGRPDNTLPPRPFGERFLGKVYALKPVKDVEQMRIMWMAPPIADKRLQMPHLLLNFCIAHEGEGSIIDCLRREGLAMELSCGVNSDGISDNTACSVTDMTIKLTAQGLQQYERVLQIVHSYIGMMGSRLPELQRIHHEVFCIERCAFRFKEESEPADNAADISHNMQRLPKELWLMGDRLPMRYDPQLISEYFGHLRPDNCCVLLVAKSLSEKCTSTTDWFAIHYGQLQQEEAQVANWRRCYESPDAQLLAACQLDLPPPNPFVPERFDVLPAGDIYASIGISSVPENPVQLKLDDANLDKFGSLFYLKEQKFLTPRAVVFASLDCPVICNSLQDSALAHLWVYLVKFQLHKETYAAEEAHLSFDLRLIEPFTIRLKVEGFSDKLLVLYKLVLAKMQSISQLLSAADPCLKFDSAKEEVRKSFVNGLLAPEKLAGHLRLFCLEQHRHLRCDELASLESLTVSDVAQFHQRLLAEASVKVYVHGNCSVEEAKEYYRAAVALLPPNCTVATIKNTCCELPTGRTGTRVQNLKDGDVNNVLFEYFQLPFPPSLRDSALNALLLHIMSEPCFDYLRTKLQLGYHVMCDCTQTSGTLGFIVFVLSQADKFTAAHLQRSVDNFLVQFSEFLQQLTQEKFATFVQSLIDQRLTEDVTMAQHADRNWAEIADASCLFDRRSREIQYIGQFTKEDVIGWYKLAVDYSSRRSFTFQIEGAEQKCLHSGGSKGFSLSLQQLAATEACINWVNELPQFKAGTNFNIATPIVQ